MHQLCDYVLGSTPDNPQKLIIAEDNPVMVWFWEALCSHLYIETEVLHSKLNNEARWNLLQRSNDPKSSLQVLVMMYNVGAQGVNLDPCCCHVQASISIRRKETRRKLLQSKLRRSHNARLDRHHEKKKIRELGSEEANKVYQGSRRGHHRLHRIRISSITKGDC